MVEWIGMKKTTLIVIAVIVIILGYVGVTYNKLVTAKTSA